MAGINPMTTPPKSVDHYVARLPVLIIASGILLASAGLALALYLQTPEPVEGGPISDTATLIVYEGDDCPPCETFRETGGRAYRRDAIQAQAPLIYRPLEASIKSGAYRLKGPVQKWSDGSAVRSPWPRGRPVRRRPRGSAASVGRRRALLAPRLALEHFR